MNPYEKIRHKAGKVNAKGEMSAICFPVPHAINLKKETWTLIDNAVTCPKCRKILSAK